MNGSTDDEPDAFRRLASDPHELSALMPAETLDGYDPALKMYLGREGIALPAYIEQEFEGYLECERFDQGYCR